VVIVFNITAMLGDGNEKKHSYGEMSARNSRNKCNVGPSIPTLLIK